MHKLNKLFLRVGVAATMLAPVSTLAATNPFDKAKKDLNTIGSAATGAGQQQELPTIIGNIINIVLGFLGIVLLFYVLYAGFLWMTAGGDDKKVDKAKDMLKNAIIGLILILASVAIANFVVNSLVDVTTKGA